ncbi:triosephosphate isomerase [Capsulimonas corticalis]|uniref:Triosephosphate isomerase n=1 Tax=Capsulimonas corticalis TaxID=2219043 RepID=A0A402CPV6_9BACT|nr:triose-phosphate isomerase [Capsulimonas corticalis]BDI32933.1 triosephosphate isomerase [Capsulimonas corticalis]
MRKKIIAGNWKLNKTVSEALAFAEALAPLVAGKDGVDIVICPPYTALYSVSQAFQGTGVATAAQGLFWKPSGAYTSYVSAPLILDAGAKYVLIGHSETRGRFGVAEEGLTPDLLKAFGETDSGVNVKTHAALQAGLIPIVCIGETLAERKDGSTDAIVRDQVTKALDGVSSDLVRSQLIFAYEPVWAIGTGEVCAADEAGRVCGVVRKTIESLYGADVANAVRIQYGGSMKPDNAAELLAQEHIDGGLIGGASLKPADFAAIVAAAAV